MVLKERRVKALAKGLHGPGQLVFCMRRGAPLGHRNVSRAIRSAGGIEPVTVAALAGDKVETILKVYAHEYDRGHRSSELRDRIAAANAI